MPIEFRCTQCNRLLRTGEGTAGRQAKCPECGAIVTVPAEGATVPGEAPSSPPPPGAEPQSPFSAIGPPPAVFDPDNPYAAPSQYAAPPVYAGPGTFTPTIIDFGDIFTRTWAVFKQQWGMCVAAALIAWAVGAAFGMAVGMGTSIIGAIAQDPVISMLCSLLGQAISGLFNIWIGIGLVMFFLKTARGQQASLGDVFAGGPYYLTVLLATICVGLINFLILAVIVGPCALAGWVLSLDVVGVLALGGVGLVVAAVPIVFVSLVFSQFTYLIVDRNAGPIDSLKMSADVTRGNRLTIFLIWLAFGAASFGLILFTCGLGMFVVMPVGSLLWAIMYLAMTGQRTADQMLPGWQTAQ